MRKSSIILQRRTGKIWEELPDHWASTINSPDKAQDPAATGPQYLTSVQVPIVLTSITLAAFLLLLDSTIVSTAVPSITSEFHSLKDVGWYGAAYQLSRCVGSRQICGILHVVCLDRHGCADSSFIAQTVPLSSRLWASSSRSSTSRSSTSPSSSSSRSAPWCAPSPTRP